MVPYESTLEVQSAEVFNTDFQKAFETHNYVLTNTINLGICMPDLIQDLKFRTLLIHPFGLLGVDGLVRFSKQITNNEFDAGLIDFGLRYFYLAQSFNPEFTDNLIALVAEGIFNQAFAKPKNTLTLNELVSILHDNPELIFLLALVTFPDATMSYLKD